MRLHLSARYLRELALRIDDRDMLARSSSLAAAAEACANLDLGCCADDRLVI